MSSVCHTVTFNASYLIIDFAGHLQEQVDQAGAYAVGNHFFVVHIHLKIPQRYEQQQTVNIKWKHSFKIGTKMNKERVD